MNVNDRTVQLQRKARELRAKNPRYPFADAVRWARWILAEPAYPFDPWNMEKPVHVDVDGFDVVLTCRPDYDSSNPSDYLGTFTDDPTDAELNPDAWYTYTWRGESGREFTRLESVSRHYKYVRLESGFDRESVYTWAHREGGMSRSVARDYAADSVRDSVATMLTGGDYVSVHVRVYFRGVELGAADMYGFDVDASDTESAARMVADLAGELLADAVAAARESLDRLRERDV